MKQAAFWIAAGAAFLLWPDELNLGGLLLEIAVLLGVVLVGTVVAVQAGILKALPEDPGMQPVNEYDVPREVAGLARDFERAGFERAASALRFDLGRPVVLVPLIRRGDGTMATVYRFAAEPPKLGYDVVSALGSPDAMLTSAADPAAGVLPAPATVLRQILPGASPADLVARHDEALADLRRQGVDVMTMAPSAVPALIERSLTQARAHFLTRRWVHTLVALARTVMRRNPYLGPLRDQSGVEDRIAAVRAVGGRATGRRSVARAAR